MITSTEITNTESFAFIRVLVFMLLSPKVLFINRKDNRNFNLHVCTFKRTKKRRGLLGGNTIVNDKLKKHIIAGKTKCAATK